MEQITDTAIELLKAYGPKILGALLILIIGFWLIKMINKRVRKSLEKGKVSPSLKPFLRSLISVVLKALLLISVLSILGIPMTSFVAILAAAGLAIGLALSGTLQNFAGGVMILLFKPFKTGEFIEAQGYSGTVFEIQIFNTILKTPDNKIIIIPNGGLSNNSVTNYSREKTRRVDWTFGIGYGDDVDKAKSHLLKLIKEDSRIMEEPAPALVVSALADSSVNITVKVWVNSGDYWSVFFTMNEKVYKTFANENLNIPFPQMDVHLQK